MIHFKKLNQNAQLPTRSSDGAAGLDIYCIEPADIWPGIHAVLPTGLAVSIPRGYYGRIAPRSGLAVKHGIGTLAGVIDSDFRGEIRVALYNHGERMVELRRGDRIAQLIIERCAMHLVPEWADDLDDTERGTGGFGSTGV